MVMVSNFSGMRWGWLAGKFPGRIGHLYSSDGFRGPWEFCPYALDNGRYPAWSSGKKWDGEAYLKLLERAGSSGQAPLWVLAPDVVADHLQTIDEWHKWRSHLGIYGWPLAFAVQDGMVPTDVPEGAEVVFVGGTAKWKWQNLHVWTDAFKRVHVGRVNGGAKLWYCHELGVESVDGTGWKHVDNRTQWPALVEYLKRSERGDPAPNAGLFGPVPSYDPVRSLDE